MNTSCLGVIGLGTMGANLARNAARNGARVILYNRTGEKTDAFMEQYGKEGEFVACKTLKEFCSAFKGTKVILLMVKAGDAVDQMIEELIPLLSKGDILIDAGNSHDIDTMVRERNLQKNGIFFLGMGVSGGEEGALKGPSMMPGGSKEAYEKVAPLLMKMAADDGNGGKCVTYIGPEGTGHFVKMVHNGIEYGIMQLIAEAYHLLKVEATLDNADMGKIFEQWNTGYLESFLLEITAKIFHKKDPESGEDLLDLIKDAAGQKGTGKWTTLAAMNYGVAVPTITAAVDARIVSSAKDFRLKMSNETVLARDNGVSYDKALLIEMIRDALELSVLNAYAQGFQLLSNASDDGKWNLNLSEIARIWRGGCIIRSNVLEAYQRCFAGDEASREQLRVRFSEHRQLHWRRIVALGALHATALPAMSASLSYYDAYRSAWLPQNLTQAQRDLFGAHTYERLDRPGSFHTEW